jgi:AraC family transcriptional activator of pobA
MMKKEELNQLKFESISDALKAMGLPQPQHPLICLLNGNAGMTQGRFPAGSHVLNFYKIAYKPQPGGKLKYGPHYYDFDGGGLMFASPNQVISHAGSENAVTECSSYTLLIHPDFLWNYPLAKNIKQFGFFSYATNETLHLSTDEEATIVAIFKMMEAELAGRIDDFSQSVVISQIELLLNFANRFYKRQFITRKVVNNDLLEKLDGLLDNYFDAENSVHQGLPSVHYLADRLNVSANYLSDMLRSLIGQTAQHYIHGKLIDKAKETLSTTSLSVSQVAYVLGFEHPQSFSKLFKSKTSLSPLEFRKSFN